MNNETNYRGVNVMSDYGDFCKEQRAYKKRQKEKSVLDAHKEGGLIELIESEGACEKTYGVYRLGSFDIYPYKNSAFNYVTNEFCSIKHAIKNKDNEYISASKTISGRKNWLDKNLEFKTNGVYRYAPLNIDVYPNKFWARNYKTGEKYTIDEVKKMILENIKEQDNGK